jgi:tRNA dimethylallyltransferase
VRKTVIIIAGPTAVGKTAIAIEIAKQFTTEIISADSRQCYKELKIGVARPSGEELAIVPHHFIASHSIHQIVNAGVFERYALEKAGEIFKKNNVAVMVGGTGLYIKAFCEGIDEMPEIPDRIRNEITLDFKQNGLRWLQHQVKTLDPEFYSVGEIKNPQRMMRALEIFKSTGKSILHFRRREKTERDFNIIKIGLEVPKEILHQNINNRVDVMMNSGLMEEVFSLIPYQQINALQTVGYKELFAHFNGETGLPEAIENIKKNTRQYAKRQLTWFKKDEEYNWFEPQPDKIKEHLNDALIYK